ncbi:MAG: hypothetical protein V4664_01640 [Patescibacteria group bacterium]
MNQISKRKSRFNSTAVLLIDMQSPFIDKLASDVRKDLLNEQVKLVSECARLNVPLIVLETES